MNGTPDSEPRVSKQSAFPYTRNLTTTYVGNVALKLWKALTKGKKDKSASGRIHNIGISFGGLSAGEAGQKSIEGFLAQHRDGSPLSEPENPSKKRPRDQVNSGGEGASFICSRCSKRITLPSQSGRNVDDHSLADAIESLKMEHEDFHFAHDLALEDNQPSSGLKSKKNSDEPSSKKARKKTHQIQDKKASNEGIAKYFSPGPSTSSTLTKGSKK